MKEHKELYEIYRYQNISSRIASCTKELNKYRQKQEINLFFIEDINQPLQNLLRYKGNIKEIDSSKITDCYGVTPQLSYKIIGDQWEELEKTVSTLEKLNNKKDISAEELDSVDKFLLEIHRNCIKKTG